MGGGGAVADMQEGMHGLATASPFSGLMAVTGLQQQCGTNVSPHERARPLVLVLVFDRPPVEGACDGGVCWWVLVGWEVLQGGACVEVTYVQRLPATPHPARLWSNKK